MNAEKQATILEVLDDRTERLRVATDGLRQITTLLALADAVNPYRAHDPASDALLIARDTLRKLGKQ